MHNLKKIILNSECFIYFSKTQSTNKNSVKRYKAPCLIIVPVAAFSLIQCTKNFKISSLNWLKYVKLSTGQITLRSRCFLSLTSTMFTGLGFPFLYPLRKPAMSSIGACVADSPILTGSPSMICVSLSTDSERCVPLLLLARS